jgi:hypothetical protein
VPYFRAMTKKYIGSKTGGPGGIDGYAGLRIGTTYTGAPTDDGRISILLPTGRPTSVTVEQWQQWFR